MNSSNVDVLKHWVETYFQLNMLLFPVKKAFTPYKAKLLVMVKLYENGTAIKCHYEHLSEGTENSNHANNFTYHNHTMKDGGYIDRHVASEFIDLFDSFLKAVKIGMRRSQLPTELVSTILHNFENAETWNTKFMPLYLATCKHVHPPPFPVGRKDPGTLMRGVRLYFIGKFNQAGNSIGPDGKTKTVSAVLLKEMVTSMGGTAVTDGTFDSLCDAGELQHSFIVIQDQGLFTKLKEKIGLTKDEDATSAKFMKSTRSDWGYLKFNYVVDCFKKQELLDTTPYLFNVDRSTFTHSRKAAPMTRLTIRQRDHNELMTLASLQPGGIEANPVVPVLHQNILARCALARTKAARKKQGPARKVR